MTTAFLAFYIYNNFQLSSLVLRPAGLIRRLVCCTYLLPGHPYTHHKSLRRVVTTNIKNPILRIDCTKNIETMSDSETENRDDRSAAEGGSAGSPTASFTVSEVLIELDDNLKSKLVQDLKSICDVDENTARFTLEAHRWNMQSSIDMLLAGSDSDSDIEDVTPASVGIKMMNTIGALEQHSNTISSNRDLKLSEVCSPQADNQKEKESEIERKAPVSDGIEYSNWAPEKFSVMSWNLDGLDDKNLEKRTEYVISLIEKEKHDVIFFQELLPYTFDYIGRRLISQYRPVIGTKDPTCDYLTATFLRNNSVHYEEDYIIPYPNSTMGRNLLVTKAFIGRAKLALLNSHLESTAEFSAARKVQLRTCFDICKTFDPEYNVIFGGDLNLRDKEVAGSLPSEMCDLWVQCGSRPTCQYTWDLTRNTNKQMPSKYQPRCRFDRFYFRNSTPPTITPEFFGVTGIEKVPNTQSFPSDHWAILSFFALSKETRKPIVKKRKADEVI